MRRLKWTVVLGVAMAGVVSLGLTFPASHAQLPVTSITDVVFEPQEDDPRFDCRIHGNRICGPVEG